MFKLICFTLHCTYTFFAYSLTSLCCCWKDISQPLILPSCLIEEDLPLLSCIHWRSTSVPLWHNTARTLLVPQHKQVLHTEKQTRLYTPGLYFKYWQFFKVSLTLTLLGDEVCEDAVQRAAVCQVVQRPGAVWEEQRLVSSTWRGSSWHDWAKSNHQSTWKQPIYHEIIFLTIYGFKFGWCCVGFHVEVLHPSSSAFIHSNKVYWLSLQ